MLGGRSTFEWRIMKELNELWFLLEDSSFASTGSSLSVQVV